MGGFIMGDIVFNKGSKVKNAYRSEYFTREKQ